MSPWGTYPKYCRNVSACNYHCIRKNNPVQVQYRYCTCVCVASLCILADIGDQRYRAMPDIRLSANFDVSVGYSITLDPSKWPCPCSGPVS
jgi:hypothetical protein